MRPILVTGAAGFIGYHVAERLLAEGREVVGVDSFTAYYSAALKEARFARLEGTSGFTGLRLDVSDAAATRRLFEQHGFREAIHLAAQPGVRYALENPEAYAESNLAGFASILEASRHAGLDHLVYASSSSVYGANLKLPFSEHDPVDRPISLYAATKRANELMAHAYAHLFDIPTTGLRFFTVYGPWGRPDMAVWLFTEAIIKGKPIHLFNDGRMRRDFTYVDDVVEALVRLIDRPPAANPAWSGDAPDPATSRAPWRVFNIGNSSPVELIELVRLIEEAVGKGAIRELAPMQPGDVAETRADVSALEAEIGFVPATPIGDGISRFVAWYRDYASSRCG